MSLETAIEKLKDPKLNREDRWLLLVDIIQLMAIKIGMLEARRR